MPFSRKASPAPTHGASYDHTSVELGGYEFILGTDRHGVLEESQLSFLEGLNERVRKTKTAFSVDLEADRLTERAIRSKDPAIQALCSRALQLLECQGPTLMPAALELATAAENFLKTRSSHNGLDRKLAADIRLRAREAMQECIDKTVKGQTRKLKSQELANSMSLRAQAMRKAFGVFRAGDEVRLDFILDAHGKAAYAFKPMSALAPRAISMSRLHFRLQQALAQPPGTDFSSGYALASLALMPGTWSGLQDEDPQKSRPKDHQKLGLLMKAPPGFDLCLSAPEDGEDAEDAGRARLAEALNRAPGPQAMEALSLAALCAGELRASRQGVLVDEAGRSWDLQPERYLAEPPEDPRGHTNVPAKELIPSSTDADPGMPMRLDLQRALSLLSGSMTADVIAKRCSPTERELDLVGKAMGLSGPAAAEAALALWPSRAVVQRSADQVQRLSDWAKTCVATREQLLDQPADEVLDLVEMSERMSSLNWFLSTLEVKEDA